MAVDEFGREVPGGRDTRRDRSPSAREEPSLYGALPTSRYSGDGGAVGGGGGRDHYSSSADVRDRDGRDWDRGRDRGRGRERDRDYRPSYHHNSHHQSSYQGNEQSPYGDRDRSSDRHPSSYHGSGRKRKQRSESPDQDRSGSGRRPRSSHTPRSLEPHMSTLYTDDPMLCEFLWKEKNPEYETADPEKCTQAYLEYRKTYCLGYIRTFFNQHMDDSWFRRNYSPLEKYRYAKQERQRASREASSMIQEAKDSLSQGRSSSATNDSTCYFVIKARLGGGVKQSRSGSAGYTPDSVEARLDLPLKAPNKHSAPSTPSSSSGPQKNAVPTSHLSSMASKVIPIHDVPPYVTDNQLITAMRQKCSLPDARHQKVELYSSTVNLQDLTRMAYFWCSEEMARDILTKLHQLERSGAAAPDTTSHVPRKEDTNLPKFLDLQVECSDAYGRTEIDADGKGTAPEEADTVTPRTTTVQLCTRPLKTDVKVLSGALSSKRRIAADRKGALELAEAWDKRRGVPSEHGIESLLQSISLNDPSTDDATADSLDVTIAYLRRVHLISFYSGCQIAPNFGDVLNGSHYASNIHLRLSNADELLQESEDAVTNKDNQESKEAPEPVQDLLVQRLENSMAKALEEVRAWLQQNLTDGSESALIDKETDERATKIESNESQVEPTWIDNHALDEDGRARCGFHFCRKLFKDSSFLRKHLMKKHGEFLKAERAKCHDSSMMEEWDKEEQRPVPPVLVNCGKNFPATPSPVLGSSEPLAADPEPELWQREEKRREEDAMEARMRREKFETHQQNRNGYDGGNEMQDNRPPRSSTFVDVDDMKEEKVEMAFDTVEIPLAQPKKKKKKRKLL